MPRCNQGGQQRSALGTYKLNGDVINFWVHYEIDDDCSKHVLSLDSHIQSMYSHLTHTTYGAHDVGSYVEILCANGGGDAGLSGLERSPEAQLILCHARERCAAMDCLPSVTPMRSHRSEQPWTPGRVATTMTR